MAFKELADLNCENATALGGTDRKSGKKNPTSIQGYFIGSRQVASPKSKTGFAALHVFQTDKGNQGVWGKTDLDNKLRAVTAGQLVRVTFTGMQETKNNPMYKYRVEVDTDNTIDVASASSDEQGDSEAHEDDHYEEQAADEEETYADEAPPARATAPARAAATPDAARQAKVAALLNGSRAKRA